MSSTLGRRSQESESLIGPPVAPRSLLSRVSSHLVNTPAYRGISTKLCVVRQVVAVLPEAVSSIIVDEMPWKHRVLPDVEPSNSESSTSESKAGDLPAPAPQLATMPVVELVPTTFGSSSACGAGASTQTPTQGGKAAGRPKLHKRGCKPMPPKRKYEPHTCGLCDHPHVFATRKGLNKHSTSCHGKYYSLSGNCFVPIGEADLRSRLNKLREAQQHRWPHGAGPRSRMGEESNAPRQAPPVPRPAVPLQHLLPAPSRYQLL